MLGGASMGRVGWGDGRVLVAGVAVDGMTWGAVGKGVGWVGAWGGFGVWWVEMGWV